MKYIIPDCNFTANKYSCGHETICQCMDISFNNSLKPEDIYFLGNGLRFEFLHGDISLGYNDLKLTMEGICTSITPKIKRVVCTGTVDDIFELIAKEIRKNHLIILYLRSEALYYHSIAENRYPYHMVVVYGIDYENKLLILADLFVNDDHKATSIFLEAPIHKMLVYACELLIFEKEKSLELKDSPQYHIKVLEELHFFVAESGGLYFLEIYFQGLEKEKNAQYKVNSIISAKWNIIDPFLFYTKDYIKNKVLPDYITKIESLMDRWQKILYKYIKYCYMNKVGNYYQLLSIDKALEETRCLFIELLNKLEGGTG